MSSETFQTLRYQQKLAFTNKRRGSFTSSKLTAIYFWQITSSYLSKCRSAISTLVNGPEMLSSTSDKAKLFAEMFSEISNLDELGSFLPFQLLY